MKIPGIIGIIAWINSAALAQAPPPGTPGNKLSDLFSHRHRGVLVTAHRGDWRNAPENSVQGLNNCIAMGVDISEFDLKKQRMAGLLLCTTT